MEAFEIISIIIFYAFIGHGVLYTIKDENKAPKNAFYKLIGIAGFPIILCIYGLISLFDTDFK